MKLEKMKKEDFELMSYKDITNLFLEERGPANTIDLFKVISKALELTEKEYEEKIGDYYMMLTTDKRFVLLNDGIWDLRKRHTSDKIVVVTDDDDDQEDDIYKSKEEEIMDDDSYDKDNIDETFDDDDDLKDLVILDEDEIELE